MKAKAKKTVAIINAIESGATNAEIAKKFGVPLQTIYNIKYNMKKGVKKPKTKIVLTHKKEEASNTISIAQYERMVKTMKDDIDWLNNERTQMVGKFHNLLKEVGDQAAIISYLERKIESLLAQQFNNQPLQPLKGE